MSLERWMNENTSSNVWWYVKRLSGNDTLANRSHQAGPYVPKSVLFEAFPSLTRAAAVNPDTRFELRIDSHGTSSDARAIWYNNKQIGGTRDEARVTNLGGSSSPLLDPESTGAIVVFAFHRHGAGDASGCNVWIARSVEEEDLIEERVGTVEPGTTLWILSTRVGVVGSTSPAAKPESCWLAREEIPAAWLDRFPTARDIVGHTIRIRPDRDVPVDDRLLRRRTCEYQVFQSVEEAVELPVIRRGFDSMGGFLERAQSILQRRKARSGMSLELHLEAIFEEEGLIRDRDFSCHAKIEGGKTPDFLFPGQKAYEDPTFPPEKLRMLGVKTTCRDRWRQILNEADRIPRKHLFTLQEGVSENQFQEMRLAGVTLVVPRSRVATFPKPFRSQILTLGTFLREIRPAD